MRKPPKPYAQFPLFPHDTGRWAKWSRRKTLPDGTRERRLFYFTPWRKASGEWVDPEGGWQAALAEFKARSDEIYGATPEFSPLNEALLTGRERLEPLSTPMTDALRESIRDCGLTAREISRRTGLHVQTISRFLNGYDLMLASAELVASVTGLELRFRHKTMTSTFEIGGGP